MMSCCKENDAEPSFLVLPLFRWWWIHDSRLSWLSVLLSWGRFSLTVFLIFFSPFFSHLITQIPSLVSMSIFLGCWCTDCICWLPWVFSLFLRGGNASSTFRSLSFSSLDWIEWHRNKEGKSRHRFASWEESSSLLYFSSGTKRLTGKRNWICLSE